MTPNAAVQPDGPQAEIGYASLCAKQWPDF
jgi:hypothetical protein